MQFFKKNTWCFASVLLTQVAFSSEYQIASTGYSDPFTDKGIVEVINEERFSIECVIKAVGIARSKSGSGPLKGKVNSLPIRKTLKPGRAFQLEFDFSTALGKMRKRWRDSSAQLVELGSSSESDIIDPNCVQHNNPDELENPEITDPDNPFDDPGEDESNFIQIKSQCEFEIEAIFRVFDGNHWIFETHFIEQGASSPQSEHFGNSEPYYYARNYLADEWSGSHRFQVNGETLFFKKANSMELNSPIILDCNF